jgi:hypothetical protein
VFVSVALRLLFVVVTCVPGIPSLAVVFFERHLSVGIQNTDYASNIEKRTKLGVALYGDVPIQITNFTVVEGLLYVNVGALVLLRS